METADLLKKVRRIEIKTKGLSKHLFSGEYHSAFKGRGMSFSEVRDYSYGDDVRNIDWNVTARTGSPHVKIFEEERELTMMLLIDVSASGYFGTKGNIKQELLTEIAAVLSFSAIQNNDKVGVILFSDQVEKYIPPKKGKQHILLIIRELIQFKPQHTGTNIGEALKYFNNVLKKRTICFLMSDFLNKGYEDALRIAARRHDMVGVKMIDPFELEIKNGGLHRVLDPESGRMTMVDLSSKSHKKALTEYFSMMNQYYRQACLKSGTDLLPIYTDKPYVNALMQFFKKRKGA